MVTVTVQVDGVEVSPLASETQAAAVKELNETSYQILTIARDFQQPAHSQEEIFEAFCQIERLVRGTKDAIRALGGKV